MAAGAAVVIAVSAVAAVLLLRPDDRTIDSRPARERFDTAYRAVDENLEYADLEGCPQVRIDVIFQTFIHETNRPDLYDLLDRSPSSAQVFFDDNVDRPLLQCRAGDETVRATGSPALNNIGLTFTRAYGPGFARFMEDLLKEEESKPSERCIGVDIEQLDDHAGGEVFIVTCRHQEEFEAVDFRQIAWMNDDVLVLFALQGTASNELDGDVLRTSLLAALPLLMESVANAEQVKPLSLPD